MKKMKPYLKYLLYTVAILILIVSEIDIINHFSQNWSRTFTITFFPFLLQFCFNVVIGVVLGLDHLLMEHKKRGRYSMNLPKLIMMGLPALYLSLTILALFSGSTFISETLYYYPNYLIEKSNEFSVVIAQVTLGYVFITSFYKKNIN